MNEAPNSIRSRYYRVSAKALILNETKDAFLITKEDNGRWELPGGGIEWGDTAPETIRREVAEEMGITPDWVAPHPSYFLTAQHSGDSVLWVVNILYETTLPHLDFTPSNECVEIAFVNQDNAREYELFNNVELLLEQFDAMKHQK